VNNFEFLRLVNIGQYLPLDSFLHRRDPRAMIVAYSLLLAATTVTKSLPGILLALGFVFILFFIGRIPLKYALRGLLPPLPFLLILAILQVFISIHLPDTQPLFQWRFISIYPEGLVAASKLIIRFVALILELSLVTFTLSTSELIHGTESLLKPLTTLRIPVHDLVMVIQVTFRFIPFLAQTAERIAKAQASRGAEWGTRKGGLLARTRQFIPLIVPLFMISLERAETMALAMDARGYGSLPRRSSMVVLSFGWLDGWTILVAAVASAAILLAG
jgi:energy-coupling factor transport system permease protein